MRCLVSFNVRSSVRLIVCLAVLSAAAAAHSHPPLNNLSANPRSARILFSTPFDFQTNDPQRKVCVLPPADVPRASGHRLDKRVLKYLREMVAVSRRLRRRDMAWYYEEAWEFAAVKIYGALPPRKQDLLGTFYQPSNPAVPESFRPPASQCPMRRIVKLNDHPHGFTTLQWEMLECRHELSRYPGYNNPVKSRRCIYCAYEALSKKKKPAASVSAIAKAKAVGA